MKKVNILLVINHEMVRESIRTILLQHPAYHIVGEIPCNKAVPEALEDIHPHMIIMDMLSCRTDSNELIRTLKKQYPNVKVLVMSDLSDKASVLRVLGAGCSGYLLKSSSARELIESIDIMMKGQVYLSNPIADYVMEEYVDTCGDIETSAFAMLTEREREILQLLSEGWTTRQIAGHLLISVKTIDSHRLSLMHKLETQSMASLTKYAVREGLTSVDD